MTLLKKKEAILEEITSENYDVASIAEKTNTKPKRVIVIIDRLVIREKIEGWMNEENTRFLPGIAFELYSGIIKNANYRLMIAMLVLGVALLDVILVASMVFYAPFIAWIMLGVLVVISINSTYTKSMRLGTPGFIRNRWAVVITALATIMTFIPNIVMWILVAIFLSKQLT